MQENIEVSVVLPCLNEEKAVGTCVDKIKAVFSREDIRGEIIVVDNGSIDRSAEVARQHGARVISEPERGYGAAYLCGLKEAQGEFIIIGDSDNSYDFSEIPKFLKLLREGFDLIMGSRLKGAMERGAMSWSHRYIGNPILSWMCRLFFRTRLSDIHCGMRAFSRSAYAQMCLSTTGMEFATEMVVSALQNNLKIKEIPISYYLRQGRSKLNPLVDAWRHIRFMLLYCPLWLYLIPGMGGFIFGMLILAILMGGPVLFLGRLWDLHLMVFSGAISILSYQVLNLGIYAHLYAIEQGFLRHDKLTGFLQHYLNIEKGLILGSVFFLIGFGINILILLDWFSRNFGALDRIRELVLATTFLVIGLQTIFSSFFIGLLSLRKK